MNRHQVLTGAVNPGDRCFAVGYVEGVPFTAYASGCNIIILSSNFQRVQIIPGDNQGNIQVGCIDCSTENGKIAASFANQVYIFEPTPQVPVLKKGSHKLDYQWHRTGSFQTESLVSNLSWNHNGSRILTGSNSIQLWACHKEGAAPSDAASKANGQFDPEETASNKGCHLWENIWTCMTAMPVFHLLFSPDGQFFASAGKADRLVKIWYQTRKPSFKSGALSEKEKPKEDDYSFVYIAHPRAVTGFSWRRTSKYMTCGAVANVLVTSCRDNICRLWSETLLPSSELVEASASSINMVHGKRPELSHKRPTFSLGMKGSRKKRKSGGSSTNASSTSGQESMETTGHRGLPLHFHISATINPNTDIPLLPTMGKMSKGSTPNFVVNWLNNKELQYTLAAETLLQINKDDKSESEFEDSSEESLTSSEDEGVTEGMNGTDETNFDNTPHASTTDEPDSGNAGSSQNGSIPSGQTTPPEILAVDTNVSMGRPLVRPEHLGSFPSASQLASLDPVGSTPLVRLQKKFDVLLREWNQSPDMLFSIHPIDGSFLLWLVDWVDEAIPGVHRQPQVSFSCRIPHAFPVHDATTLCTNLVLYRSNLTMDPRASRRQPSLLSPRNGRPGLTPSYSFCQRLSTVPAGVNIYAFTPKVSMLSKHSNGTLNQWEISFSENSKFQTVLNVAHTSRCCGHRFSLNHISCHPVLPLLLSTSHHNVPKVVVDRDIVTSRTRRLSSSTRKSSMTSRDASADPIIRRQSSINLFGRSLVSESEHQKLIALYTSHADNDDLEIDVTEKDDVVIPDEMMEQLNQEMNYPDMSAPTGLCSELILWRVLPVGPLTKGAGVVELARINSPFLSAFSHVAWFPTLLPSSCLGALSNSPSACFVASDSYSLRVFQTLVDARSFLTEVLPGTDQFEGYLSSSSPIKKFIDARVNGDSEPLLKSNVISLQSTARPGCILELDALSSAKQVWKNVQLMHIFPHHTITEGSAIGTVPPLTPTDGARPYANRFYLVVLDQNPSGETIVHMWYIYMEAKMLEVPSKEREPQVDDIPDDSSLDSSDSESSHQFDSTSVPHSAMKVCSYSHKVCTQKLSLPPGVDVVSAAPSTSHLSSSVIHPGVASVFTFSTACSDGKLRFWCCKVSSPGENHINTVEFKLELDSSSDSGLAEEICDVLVGDVLAEASYVWKEWKLVAQDVDSGSAVEVPGTPVALSCAYSGRIGCIYRTDSDSNSQVRRWEPQIIPLQACILECESSGGSEWVFEDKLDLGLLDLVPQIQEPASAVDSLNYKMMKRSSKVQDFINLKSLNTDRNAGTLDLTNVNLSPRAGRLGRPRLSLQGGEKKHLPVQMTWVSKEDGSHMLTVGMGMQVTVFAPVLPNRANIQLGPLQEKIMEKGLLVNPKTQGTGAGLLAKEDLRPKWLPLWTITLSSVDGVSPHSRMLSWVRPGILVVGLQNEMHVYSQWKGPDQISASTRKKPIRRETETSLKPNFLSKESAMSDVSNLSVDILALPMTKLDREQSYAELTRFASIEPEDPLAVDVGEPEEPVSDIGVFESSYMACPVLPQYHPKQLMELLNCGKVRRVKAILAHLVRCFAGDSTIQKALLSGDDDSIASLPETDNNFTTQSRSCSNSPVDQPSLDDARLNYIELVSIPPLPLYALIAADKAESLAPPSSTPSVTKANNLGHPQQPPKESGPEYSKLFSYSLDSSVSPTFDVFAEPVSTDKLSTVAMKMQDVTYFGRAQLRLLTNYLTHMHLPGLSSLDQMNLLALADTVASTKTEVTTHNTIGTGAAIGKDGAGYAVKTGTTSAHAGETLDECGLRFLLAMRFHVCLLRSLPPRQQVPLRHQGLATSHFAWAFHSEAEEELLSVIPGNLMGNPTWAELRAMGVGWWVRNDITLKRCIEKLAKAQFQANKDPLDAALFYLAMKKKTLVWGLFRSVSDARMTQFFSNNFSQERWRKAALKNAFALLGRQRFEHAAAFFLLAGSLKDAIAVCLDNMDDIQLAMVIARLYEEDLEMPTAQKELLFCYILGRDKEGNKVDDKSPSKDPFLRSIAHWMLKEYTQALETLIIPPARNKSNLQRSDEEYWGNPDVFNFYNYLRTHPLLVRCQFAAQDNPAGGSSVLITGLVNGDEGDTVIKDEITNLERRMFFATAHAHSAAGCPMLTLEVLSKLPPVKPRGKPSTEKSDMQRDVDAKTVKREDSTNMISTGTIGSFTDTQMASQPVKNNSDVFDWSQPLTNGKMEPELDLDWSQPIGGELDEELKLDWSDDESKDSDQETDCKGTEPAVQNHVQNGEKTTEKAVSRRGSLNGAEATNDVFAQQLKFSSWLKIMMEELRTLATGFEVEGGQLRYQLYMWLEHEVEMLKDICNYGLSNILRAQNEQERDNAEQDLENIDCVAERALHARWIDLAEKRQRAARRKKWLRSHKHLLRTLMSYAIIYGLNGGGLTSVAVELLLLIQEIQQENVQRQLATPLPLPTTLPLLSASIAACKTVMTDPMLFLRNFMHDILTAILDLTAPPSPKRHVSATVQTIHRNAMALSACIYQTLCDSESFSGAESHTKATGMDAYDGRNTNVMYRSGHLVSVNRRKRNPSAEGTLTVTSLPAKWPGVATLQALLANERDEDSSSPNVFLCESLFAVYTSILVHALTTSNANELFRLAAHPLDIKMWSSVFGGGAKVLDQPKTTPSAANAPSSGDQTLTKQRNRYMLRLMGKASSGRMPASATEEKPVPRDVFVPPETSIMDYFMIKPYVAPMQEGMDFDSDASDSSDSDSDDDEYGHSDDLDPFAPSRKPAKPTPGEREHLDYNSYSWCLMRYAFVKLILHKVQAFLPTSGIELAELPVASPKLHSILKLLEQWQQALMRKLDLFAGPPLDYLPESDGNTPSAVGGPALLRYKGLLEPTNTPFRCKHRVALPAKRLWNYLVRQEVVQDIFIMYIFKKKRMEDMVDSVRGGPAFGQSPVSKVRIIHKEQEKIPAFCFNKADWKNVTMNGEYRANPTGVVVSTQRGLLELDISLLLNPQQTIWMEEEVDEHATLRNRGGHIEEDFLMVTPIERSNPFNSPIPAPSMISSGFSTELNLTNQTGRGTNIITSRPLYHIRRLAAHPTLPYYLSGSNDGSVHMWEWGHTHKLYTHRLAGQYPKVTQIYFNDQGNKFGVADDSGKLSLWQVGMNAPTVTKPFWTKQCHSKALYDFNFLGSSSFLATAGLSVENKNVCLWDTLMPMSKSMIYGFTCHEGGCPCLAYCPRQQILITGNKRGEVSIYDIRQRKLRHTFQAHEAPIKCLTVDPSEEYFVTGSGEGDIKVWCLSVHSLLHVFPGQHPRGNFFRQSGTGVLQLAILPSSHLYSCGGDGTMKWRSLPEWDSIL